MENESRGGDLLLVNGRILTMDERQPEVEAVAIRVGRVVAAGSVAEAKAAAAPNSEQIDLKGRMATPGLNDAHAHPTGVGIWHGLLDLGTPPNQSVRDIVALVAGAAQAQPAGTWIGGRGYDQARLAEGRHPTRADLDPATPHHPVLLMRACGHIAAANSVALTAAGISSATADPDGGKIDRDEHGEPTGVLRETAVDLVSTLVGDPTEEQLVDALRLAGQLFLESGVTSTMEAGIGRPEAWRAYQTLWERDELPVRTYVLPLLDDLLDQFAAIGLRTGFGDHRFRIGAAKIFSDGSIGGRTARMRQPYLDEPDNYGLFMMEPEVLKAKILRAHQAGFQVATHAIGDAAIELVLDAYEEAMTASPWPHPRHRIEHCSIVDEAILQRIKRLGVIPVPGTSFLYHFRDVYLENLGIERLRQTYGMASFKRLGIVAAASTDAPVVPTSAVAGLQTMMTRRALDGEPVWVEEAVSLDDALRAYTVNGAYASFEENVKGTLSSGMLGDVTIFETDLRQVKPEEIAQVKVDATIVGGRVAYARS